jgi:phosphohistidine phosphatase SixA
MTRTRFLFALIAALLLPVGALLHAAALAGQQTPAPLTGEAGMSVVYLVRHAERAEDHPTDTNLSEAGHARAGELARLLADVPLDRVFSTDYRRTRQTAGPAAGARGLEIETYDGSGEGMARFAGTLRATPGHHLVVGHSNTTPWLVRALGGDPVSEIDAMEYDRLYIVVIAADGSVTSTLLRFGEPFRAGSGGGHEGP